MKVLFAVNNDKISEAVIKKYPKEYRELLSYKNVYYFNAILKEIQNDKSYDRIVISEDLEPFVNANNDSIDNFLFSHLDKISDEAQGNDGKEISIILICSERRTFGSNILSRLFSIGIYNALIGNDRSMDNLCKLINRPRTKKEAKIYYRIDQATYESAADTGEVSETEIQNILNHFKKLGKSTDRYTDSFNNIAGQYTDDQLKLIINVLPMKVKAVLEAESDKYQSLMGTKGENKVNKKVMPNEPGISVNTIGSGRETNISGPIVIPSGIKKFIGAKTMPTNNAPVHEPVKQVQQVVQPKVEKVQQVAQPKVEQVQQVAQPKVEQVQQVVQPRVEPVQQQGPVIPKNMGQRTNPVVQDDPMVMRKDDTVDRKTVPQSPVSSQTQIPVVNAHIIDESKRYTGTIEQVKRTLVARRKVNPVQSSEEAQPIQQQLEDVFVPDVEEEVEENIIDEHRRGRGRPRKILSEEELNKPKGKRGRPRKVIPGEENNLNSLLGGLGDSSDDEDEIMMPGLDEEENTILPGVEDNDSDEILPGVEDSDSDEILPGVEESDSDEMLPGVEDSASDEMLPGVEDSDSDEMIPGVEDSDSDEILPGVEDSDSDEILPGVEENDSDKMLSDVNSTETEEVDVNNLLAGLDDEDDEASPDLDEADEEDVAIPGLDEADEEDAVIPGLDEADEEDAVIPGLDEAGEEDVAIPGLDEEDEAIPGLDEAGEEDVVIPGLDEADEEDEAIPGLDEADEEDVTIPGLDESDEETILPGMGFDNEEESNAIESIKPQIDYSMSNLNSLLSKDKKIVAFVGSTKNGTSFIINNLALMFSMMGIDVAILDMTQNRNSYYLFTDSREELRKIAYTSLSKLENGYAEGIKFNKNLTVYTGLPADGAVYENAEPILSTLVQNHSLILIDTDFNTPPAYFASSQEIYLVQSMDILTIQPLTAFLRDLKFKGAWEPEKARVVINKEVPIRILSSKTIIGGMSRYNGPDMTVMTDLFNKDMVKACSIPFDEKVYAKYLETLATCKLSISSLPKQFRAKLQILGEMVYPRLNSKTSYNPSPNMGGENYNPGGNAFSSDTNNILNKMKNKF